MSEIIIRHYNFKCYYAALVRIKEVNCMQRSEGYKHYYGNVTFNFTLTLSI